MTPLNSKAPELDRGGSDGVFIWTSRRSSQASRNSDNSSRNVSVLVFVFSVCQTHHLSPHSFGPSTCENKIHKIVFVFFVCLFLEKNIGEGSVHCV